MILMPHNQKAVAKILDAYKTVNKVIYTSGVGTGKSWVFMAVDEAASNKTLYIIPKKSIRNNMHTYNDFLSNQAGHTDFATYNYFTSVEKGTNLIRKYDLVVLDECHHLGSDRYGKCLVKIMTKEKETKFLGLTATPTREDGINVSKYFDEAVNGISNFEAIEQGLMPKIIYKICYPEKGLRQIAKEYGKDYSVRLTFDNADHILSDAVKTYQRNKWICFFSNVNSLKHYESMVRRIFAGYEVMTLYSSLNNLDEVIDRAQKADKAVILSCNILLEGVHLPNIDGIILFRDVTSMPCFEQMIGRVCSIGKETEPIVLDCSASAWKLMIRLQNVNDSSRGKIISPNPSMDKTIINIGLAGKRDFDIKKLLDLFDEQQYRRHKTKEETEDSARNAILKYQGFVGETPYEKFDMFRKSSNWSVFKACCKTYNVAPEKAFQYMVS